MLKVIAENSELIAAGIVIIINAVLTRVPSIKENDIFHVVGTIAKNVFGKLVTPVK